MSATISITDPATERERGDLREPEDGLEGAAPGLGRAVVFGEFPGAPPDVAERAGRGWLRRPRPPRPPRRARLARHARRRARHLLLTAAGLATVAVAAWWVTSSPLFHLRSLRIEGTVHLGASRVAELGELSGRTNVFWLSPNGVARRIERDPWVLWAKVSRSLPGSVVVEVRERVPVAALSGRRMVVAGDGVVMARRTGLPRVPAIPAPGPSPLPGSRISAAWPPLAVVRALPQGVRMTVATVRMGRSGAELVLRDGVRVQFGDAGEARLKGATLWSLLRWLARKGVRPASIDLRAPGAPAVTASPSG